MDGPGHAVAEDIPLNSKYTPLPKPSEKSGSEPGAQNASTDTKVKPGETDSHCSAGKTWYVLSVQMPFSDPFNSFLSVRVALKLGRTYSLQKIW